MNFLEIEDIVRLALMEDIGSGDITTTLTIPTNSISHAQIIANEEGVIAGLQVAALVFALTAESYGIGNINPLLNPKLRKNPTGPELMFDASETIKVTKHHGAPAEIRKPGESRRSTSGKIRETAFLPTTVDGASVSREETVAEIVGPTAMILTAERTALNILQRMSGIATRTAKLASMIGHTGAKIVDTRKTVPGLRILDKYAVRMGGGSNHRFGLYDAVLIKDNHIHACGGIKEAIMRAKAGAPHTIKIEVEADTIEQVREALESGADMILLDNMSLATLKEAVGLCRGRALTEASGRMSEETIVEVAEAGVDIISVGALTHSVKALDLSLEIID